MTYWSRTVYDLLIQDCLLPNHPGRVWPIDPGRCITYWYQTRYDLPIPDGVGPTGTGRCMTYSSRTVYDLQIRDSVWPTDPRGRMTYQSRMVYDLLITDGVCLPIPDGVWATDPGRCMTYRSRSALSKTEWPSRVFAADYVPIKRKAKRVSDLISFHWRLALRSYELPREYGGNCNCLRWHGNMVVTVTDALTRDYGGNCN